MILTNKQEVGLKIALERFKNNEKYTVISGYAGVGKSTLVRFIIEAIDVEESKVCYAAYTGKAAEVLRKKGNRNAMTLHKLLYDSFPRPGGGFYRRPKIDLGFNIIVVDEVSMVPKSMIDLLMRYQVYIIFLGDPFQLPQIDTNESHNLLDNPHIFLDEVMRQAQESEIIRLTMGIREGKEFSPCQGEEIMLIPKKYPINELLISADQVICATNKTRHELNKRIRKLLNYNTELPQSGEKMICLRNYWDDCSDNGENVLVNGTTGIIQDPFETFIMAPYYVNMRNHKMESIRGNFVTDDGSVFSQVEMDKQMILTGQKCIDAREAYQLGKLKLRLGDIVPREFTFGYVVTAHKAQGSEFDKVLVIEETFPFKKIEHARWLYTACTRASDKLILRLEN